MNFTYNKSETLKSKKDIEALFLSGKSFSAYPLRVVYKTTDKGIKAGVSVSKRNFKTAVHRNRIKRILREAYRLNKNMLNNPTLQGLDVMFLYIGKTLPDLATVEVAMKTALTKLNGLP